MATGVVCFIRSMDGTFAFTSAQTAQLCGNEIPLARDCWIGFADRFRWCLLDGDCSIYIERLFQNNIRSIIIHRPVLTHEGCESKCVLCYNLLRPRVLVVHGVDPPMPP
jgi:hypothetical protein